MYAISSLLVRDGVVSIATIEEALQHQVLSGVDMDAALLELGVVPENVLAGYRAAAFGLPAVDRDTLMHVGAGVSGVLPKSLAHRYRVIPFDVSDDSLVVAAAAPLPTADLEHLAFLLGKDVRVHIATEVRVVAALARHYGVETSARARHLADQLDQREGGELPDIEPASELPIEPQRARSASTADYDDLSAPEPFDSSRPDAAAVPSEAPKPGGFRHDRTVTHGLAPQPAGENPAPRVSIAPVVGIGSRANTSDASSDPDPNRRLREARTRDGIVETLFGLASQLFDCTALFAVREERAYGLLSSGGGPEARPATTIAIELSKAGAFAKAWRSRRTYLGQPLEAEDQRVTRELGRGPDLPCAIVPVSLRGRVVMLVYGDLNGHDVDYGHVGPLLEQLPDVASAFERIIRERKTHGARGRHETDRPSTPRNRAGGTMAFPRREPGTWQSASAAASRDSHPSVESAENTHDPPAPATAEPASEPQPSDPPPTHKAPPVGMLSGKGATKPGGGNTRPWQVKQPDDPRADGARSSQAPARPSGTFEGRPPSGGEAGPGPMASPASDEEIRAPAAAPEPPPDGSYSMRGGPTEVVSVRRSSRPPHQSTPPPAASPDHPARPARPMRSGEASDDRRDGAPHSIPPWEKEASDPPPARGGAARTRSSNPPPDPRREDTSSPPPPDVVKIPKRAASDPVEAVLPPPISSLPPPPNMPPRDPDPDEPSVIVDMGGQVERLAHELAGCGPDDEGPVIEALLRTGEAALPVLAQHFPGPLWFDRHRPHQRLPAGSEISAFARALVAFGRRAAPYVASLLGHRDREVRFYATLLSANFVEPVVLQPLAQLLFDVDAETRALALERLQTFHQVDGYETTLSSLRALAADPESNPARRVAAVVALGGLRDTGALQLLVELLESPDTVLAERAWQALVEITAQDFGHNVRRWNAWLHAHAEEDRVQWLIDSLTHSDEAVRAEAGNELQRVTQQYFGYHPSAPKRDLERIQRRYREWWRQQGV